MKRINIIAIFFITAGSVLLLSACHTRKYHEPKGIYMPDMEYSRAYDPYTENPIFADDQTSRLPVKGTIARGVMLPYHIPESDSGYAYSGTVQNPLHVDDSLLKEGKRLFDIYCAICHGEKLNGDGPLYKGGAGPFIAAPANFIAGPTSTLPPGTIFYVATYGLRNMGSYASQVNQHQRWMIVSYIKSVERSQGISTPEKEDSTLHSLEATYLSTLKGSSPGATASSGSMGAK
ncbi:MAG: c-type cytochrome [Chitinophagaceae bacterium]